MSSPLMQATDLRKIYANGLKEVEVLKGIDLLVEPGQMTAIVGASGSGKTTLLQILGTLAPATGGQLLFKGSRLDQKSDNELAAFRNRSLGFIFQFHHLLPEFSALENVMMPGLIGGGGWGHIRDRATMLLERVGLKERLSHKPSELSGGEQQRVAVARAIVSRPALILADEPTANLDSVSAAHLMDLFVELNHNHHITFVISTHDSHVMRYAKRLIRMQDGKIIGDELQQSDAGLDA